MLTSPWSALFLLFLARLVFGAQFQSIPPIVAHLIADLGLSFAQVGWLIGIFMVPGVVVALPGGLLGRRYGDRRVLAASLLLMTLGGVLVGLAGTFPVALAGRLLSGVGGVVLIMVTTKMVTDRFLGREIATAMSVLSSGNPLGIGLVLLTLGAVAETSGWQVAMYGVTAAVGAVLLLVLLFLREAPIHDAPNVEATGREPAGAPATVTRRQIGLAAMAGLVWTCYIDAWIVFVGFTPALLIARGLSIPEAGAAVSVAAWTSMVAMPLGGWVADLTRRRDLCIVVGSLLSGACMVLLAHGGPPALWAGLYGAMTGLSAGAIMALPGEVLPPQARAVGFGVFYTVNYLGIAAAPPLAGWLRDLTAAPAAPVLLAGLFAVATVLTLGIFRLLQHRP